MKEKCTICQQKFQKNWTFLSQMIQLTNVSQMSKSSNTAPMSQNLNNSEIHFFEDVANQPKVSKKK